MQPRQRFTWFALSVRYGKEFSRSGRCSAGHEMIEGMGIIHFRQLVQSGALEHVKSAQIMLEIDWLAVELVAKGGNVDLEMTLTTHRTSDQRVGEAWQHGRQRAASRRSRPV